MKGYPKHKFFLHRFYERKGLILTKKSQNVTKSGGFFKGSNSNLLQFCSISSPVRGQLRRSAYSLQYHTMSSVLGGDGFRRVEINIEVYLTRD